MGDITTAVGSAAYEATITWTTHGVAHVTGADLGHLGFGQGWACARDHYAAMCDHATKVASERSRHLGRGGADQHLHTDLGYLGLGMRERATAMAAAQPEEIRALVAGYAAGASAWFAAHGREALPAWCRDASWIRPLTADDLWRVYLDLTLMASGRNLVDYIGSAVAPGDGEPAPVPPLDPDATPGSNAWAFGHDATADGRGIVMGNPHFPWYGEGRFWECHLRVPGDLDVYGVSLVGTPLVQIGFNRDVAWSHTFSRGHRFTVYSLELPPGRPTTYRYGDEERAMVGTDHEVAVLGADGELTSVRRQLWATHYGPMLNLPLLGWNDGFGFTYRDANLDNTRFFRTFLAMNRSRSMDDFQAAIRHNDGIPWANTLAADRTGRCWYIDASATPNLRPEASAAFEERVATDPITAMAFALRVALLPGSDPSFEWVDDPAASSPGLVPVAQLPQVERRDHLFNANDPYWFVHRDDQIEAHSAMCGLHHAPIGPRSRMNALLASAEGPVAPSGDDGRLTRADVAASLLGNHGVIAELLLDDLLARFELLLADPVASDRPDRHRLVTAVDVLRGWDRRLDVGSVGAVVFREFLASLPDGATAEAGVLWDQAYDPERPVDTPAGLAPAPPAGPDPLFLALAAAVDTLDRAGVPLDAPLGEVQFVDRAGRHWPMHGGFELEGVANVNASLGTLARADLEPSPDQGEAIPGRTEKTGIRVGGYPVIYGVSFVMIVGFDDDGPVGEGLLVYGQSQDPASPRHVDQLEAYAAKRLRPFAFHQAAIDADPQVETVVVAG